MFNQETEQFLELSRLNTDSSFLNSSQYDLRKRKPKVSFCETIILDKSQQQTSKPSDHQQHKNVTQMDPIRKKLKFEDGSSELQNNNMKFYINQFKNKSSNHEINNNNSRQNSEQFSTNQENKNQQKTNDENNNNSQNNEHSLQQKKQEEVEIDLIINKQIQNMPDDLYLYRVYESLIKKEKIFQPLQFLSKHEINCQMRVKMIDWIIEVVSVFKIKDTTFFLAINIMDRYFGLKNEVLIPEQLHLIGVCCLFIAAKYSEIYGLTMQTLFDKICHKRFTVEQLKAKELEILETLEFNITGCTIYDFVTLTLSHLEFQKYLDREDEFSSLLKKTSVYLAKLAMHNYEIINKYSFNVIAASSIYASMKLLETYINSEQLPLIIQSIKEFLSLNNNDIVNSSTDLLFLARKFETFYPNLKNLTFYNQNLLHCLAQIALKKNEKQAFKEIQDSLKNNNNNLNNPNQPQQAD